MAEQRNAGRGAAVPGGGEGSNVGEVDPGVGVDLEQVLGTAEVADESGATAGAGTTDTDGGGADTAGTAIGPDAGGEASEEL